MGSMRGSSMTNIGPFVTIYPPTQKRPRLRAETVACKGPFCEDRHFGVQARALPVGLHRRGCAREQKRQAEKPALHMNEPSLRLPHFLFPIRLQTMVSVYIFRIVTVGCVGPMEIRGGSVMTYYLEVVHCNVFLLSLGSTFR